MTFFTFWAIDAVLVLILAAHIAIGYVGGKLRAALTVCDVALHMAAMVLMLCYGCTPDELLVVFLGSGIISLGLGMRERSERP